MTFHLRTSAVVLIAASVVAVGTGTAVAGFSPRVHGALPLLQQTDFSGYWAHDAAASRIETSAVLAGLGGGGAPEDLLISQARNGTLIISSRHNPSQARAYRIEGDSLVAAPGEQGGMMTVSTRWQGSALATEGSLETGGSTLRVRELISLADDLDTMVLEATVVTAEGEASNRLVYRRSGSRYATR
jgi:hypothetical protein